MWSTCANLFCALLFISSFILEINNNCTWLAHLPNKNINSAIKSGSKLDLHAFVTKRNRSKLWQTAVMHNPTYLRMLSPTWQGCRSGKNENVDCRPNWCANVRSAACWVGTANERAMCKLTTNYMIRRERNRRNKTWGPIFRVQLEIKIDYVFHETIVIQVTSILLMGELNEKDLRPPFPTTSFLFAKPKFNYHIWIILHTLRAPIFHLLAFIFILSKTKK